MTVAGIWKAKPRFSLASGSRKCGGIGPSILNIDNLPEIVKAVDPRSSRNLDGNHPEDDDKIEVNSDIEPDETEAFPLRFNLASMDDLFNNLQDKANQVGRNFEMLPVLFDLSIYFFPYEVFLVSIFQYFLNDPQRGGNLVQLLQKSSGPHLQETAVDSEGSSEPVESGSSSENEVYIYAV